MKYLGLVPILTFMNCNQLGRMAMSADTPKRPVKARRTPPRQPDYQDEILKEQLDAICHLTDPEGKHASDRVLIYPGAW